MHMYAAYPYMCIVSKLKLSVCTTLWLIFPKRTGQQYTFIDILWRRLVVAAATQSSLKVKRLDRDSIKMEGK